MRYFTREYQQNAILRLNSNEGKTVIPSLLLNKVNVASDEFETRIKEGVDSQIDELVLVLCVN
jgi:hypothetical protein